MSAHSCTLVEPGDTRVIHVRDMPAYQGAIYVGREHSGRGRGPSFRRSPWANPWRTAAVGRVRAVELFYRWISGDPEAAAMLPPGQWKRPSLHDIRHELRGRTLACWCVPHPCHASVLARIANQPTAASP